MPRRVPDYPDAYTGFNLISSLGSYVSAAGAVVFLVVVVHALLAGKRAPANYWGDGATTLEWTVASPPPFHTFDDLPAVPSAAHKSSHGDIPPQPLAAE